MSSSNSNSFQSYLLHMRPRSWPIVACHFSVGAFAAWGTGLDFTLINLIIGAVVWAVLLNGGTLALNSAVDRDEGDVGYLDNPPPVPPFLGTFGLLLMLLGMYISCLININFFWLYAFNVVMSILYSVPPFRFKARGGPDVCINALGYGFSTFLAGWLVVSDRLEWFELLLAAGFAFLFAGFYPLTQIYQYDEDLASGAETLTVKLGVKSSLKFARIFTNLGFCVFAAAFIKFGVISYWIIPFLISWFWWLMILIRWNIRTSTHQQKKGMYAALWAWAFTDVVIVLSGWLM